MATQANLAVLTKSLDQFKTMKEALDQDIARAAMACVKAEDVTLMQQLVGTVSKDHEFSPLLLQLALEMRSAAADTVVIADDVGSKRETISQIVNDAAAGYTDTLDIEALVLSAFLKITMQFVPEELLPGLAGAVHKYILSEQMKGVIGDVPELNLAMLERIEKGEGV